MTVRPRFFIKTKDNLFFAVNSYYHPTSHYIAFLRYIPDMQGERCLDGVNYKKVGSDEAYNFIKENHPEYLFDWNVEDKKMMGVLKEDVVEILSPIEKLKEIVQSDDNNELFSKIRLLSSTFHEKCNISYDDMGVTGSTLLGLENNTSSDIDFIVFGKENHVKAIRLYSELKEDEYSVLDKIHGDYWKQVYCKRIKDDSMSLDEFIWYESRKNNRGLIRGTLFDILFTKNPEEISEMDEVNFKPLGKIRIKCKIVDDYESYDTPSTYYVSNVEIVDGPIVNIDKIVSYTHTYTGIVKNNEEVIASGVCEEVTHKDNTKTYNLIVGTTRESINEYIKLYENPLEKK